MRLVLHVGAVVEVQDALPGAPGHACARGQVGPRVQQRFGLYGGDCAVPLETGLDVDVGGVAHPPGDELVLPGILDAHGPSGALGQDRSQGGQPRLVLVAVARPQERPHYPDAVRLEPECGGQSGPVDVNTAGRLPHGQAVGAARTRAVRIRWPAAVRRLVPRGQRRPWFEGCGGVGRDNEAVLQHQVRFGETFFDIAALEGHNLAQGQVAAGMEGDRAGFQRGLWPGDVGQHRVFDPKKLQRLPSNVGIVGCHRRHFVADEADAGVEDGQVGRQPARRNVLRGNDRPDARQRPRFGGVYAQNVGMGVRTAQNRPVEHSGQLQVGGITRFPGQLLQQITADDACPRNIEGHSAFFLRDLCGEIPFR